MDKCKCGKKAVICKPYEGRCYCRDHFLRYVERKVKKTIGKNHLIEYGDKIAVAVSGGKDSMLMLYLIHKIFKNVKKVEYFAVTVDEGISGYREKWNKKIDEFIRKLGIEHYKTSYKEFFGFTLDELSEKLRRMKSGEKVCTWCGILKRYVLNKFSRELGATKVAIGHTLDDEAESIMMNFVRGDFNRFIKLGVFPVLKMNKKFVPRIKPLREIMTEDVILYDKIKKIPYIPGRCPYAKDNIRLSIQNVLNELEKKYPGTKYQIVRFYDTIQPLILKSIKLKEEFKYCKICGEPSSTEICRVCQLLKKIEKYDSKSHSSAE